MPIRIPLVIHERLGTWTRQLRPRAASWPVRVVESRSSADLVAAAGRSACPILVLDLGDRPGPGLEDLDRVLQVATDALALVLDPRAHPPVAPLARELGATHVFSGPAPPPAVAELLGRWVPLAFRRAEADGWADGPRSTGDPLEDLLASTLARFGLDGACKTGPDRAEGW